MTNTELKEEINAWIDLLMPKKPWKLEEPHEVRKQVVKGLVDMFEHAITEAGEERYKQGREDQAKHLQNF